MKLKVNMEITTPEAQAIQVWIKSHPDSKIEWERALVQLDGRDIPLEVWRIPINMLYYNIRNGRFASELLAKEKELKRKLDSYNKTDEKIIQRILLDQKPSETGALKESIRDHGQLQWGIITFDGAIINANRRMAVLSLLFDESHDPKYEYLKVAILPKNVSQQDLWRIEAGIQFGKDFILEYGPVNELLKIREGIRLNLEPADIEATLMGHYTKKEIEEKLQILNQIESYLEFIGKPYEYDEVSRDAEKFNSLQKNVLRPLRQRIPPEELLKINQIAFLLISLPVDRRGEGITHWKIRELKKVAESDDAKAELLSRYNERAPQKTNLNELVESFNTAVEITENERDQDKPKRLLRKALDAIKVISEWNIKLKDKEVKLLIVDIELEIKRLKSNIHKLHSSSKGK